MTLNPIQFAAQVNEQFLRYQLTAHPLADSNLQEQMEQLVRGSELEGSPLLKGPYLSLSKPFLEGAKVADLIRDDKLHPVLSGVLKYPSLYAHQTEALDATAANKHCLVATGTGSGKTEAFLAPIVSHCLKLRDNNAPDGITAVLVYPMNALAQDQFLRLREMLKGTGVSYGMYVGSTPATPSDVREDRSLIPAEERPSEAEMRERPPRLLITNYRQLEILLTRGRDLGMFMNAPLRYLVFDEAHTYSGVTGAEVACLVRRLRSFCGKTADEVLCIGTSATIADPETGEEAGANFAHRFFGVPREKVVLVGERYADYVWDSGLMDAPGVPAQGEALLSDTLAALERDNSDEIQEVARKVLGVPLRLGQDWGADLNSWMQKSQLVRTLAELLETPHSLEDSVDALAKVLNREISDRASARAEVLSVLALGAAARKDGNSLLRPKVHHFVQGLQGNVGWMPEGAESLQLEACREDVFEKEQDLQPTAIWNLLSCTTCGQHYFEGWHRGEDALAEEGNTIYEVCEEEGDSHRFLWTSSFPVEDLDEGSETTDRLDQKREPMWLCRWCGTPHLNEGTNCANTSCCRENSLFAVSRVHMDEETERLKTCPVCRAGKGRAREAIRPFRASTTADNHILAQDMIQSTGADSDQKLILFTDNRQDAAFQAGWMSDRARRFRFRHLMLGFLKKADRALSITDFVDCFMELFEANRGLSKALCPEVYDATQWEAFSSKLKDELRIYVRIQVLLEWTPGTRSRTGLESLGKVAIKYAGVPDKSDSWFEEWAEICECEPQDIRGGVLAWLDNLRRNDLLWDDVQPIFSRSFFGSADKLVARGYMPERPSPPKGLKLQKNREDKTTIIGLWSPLGRTNLMFLAKQWCVPDNRIEEFADSLWDRVTQHWKVEGQPLLVDAPLTGTRGGTLPGTQGARQIDSRLTGMVLAGGGYRCQLCHRQHMRQTPHMACTRHNCHGVLAESNLSAENNYDIATLEGDFAMVKPREHSAQVPHEDRRFIEEEFKKPDGEVNCLVATPTLEMGVDIGGLDMVLLRNLPPTPANYWQRVGRAGRQERMAVLYTYCRSAQHDRWFFSEPLRLLEGRVDPPRFNLRNPVMIRKHVHATVISSLLRAMSSENPWSLSDEKRQLLQTSWKGWFPTWLKTWLMTEDNTFLKAPPTFNDMSQFIASNRERLLGVLHQVYQETWPQEDLHEVSDEFLAECLDNMAEELNDCVAQLFSRFQWARRKRNDLNRLKEEGQLPTDQERVLRQCDISIMNMQKPARDNYTLTLLSVEGFLPGYSQMEGGVTAFAGRHQLGGMQVDEFTLPRPASLAVREYVPGNRIYANRGQFKLELYRFTADEASLNPTECVLDMDEDAPAIREITQSSGGYASDTHADLLVFPVSDCTLGYTSRIHDEELNRFRLPVAILGYLRDEHRGGEVLESGPISLQHRRGQHVHLVNVGPSDLLRKGKFGYRICAGCGAVRSPYDTEEKFAQFEDLHRDHGHTASVPVGLGAKVEVDGLWISSPEHPELSPLISFAESIRRGAAVVLEMAEEDLQILPIPKEEAQTVFLYDPMPGGSGLLDQIRDHWKEVRAAAMELTGNCPGGCESSCYECLRSYRNSFHHSNLDRHLAIELLNKCEFMSSVNVIPAAKRTAAASLGGDGDDTNQHEAQLHKFLTDSGFLNPKTQHDIVFDTPVLWSKGTILRTTPDLAYLKSEHKRDVAIYLDGPHHDVPETKLKDNEMREELRDMGWKVLEIPIGSLNDSHAKKTFLRMLSRWLG